MIIGGGGEGSTEGGRGSGSAGWERGEATKDGASLPSSNASPLISPPILVSKTGVLTRPAALARATLAPLKTTTLEVGWSTLYNTGSVDVGSTASTWLAKYPIKKRKEV